MKIRRAESADVDRLLELESSCFAEEIRFSGGQIAFYMAIANSSVLVAEEKDIEGYAIFKNAFGMIGHVLTINVDPTRRRRGVATALLDAGERFLRDAGGATLILEVAETNAAARALYAARGYEDDESIEDFYGPGKHALRMRKDIPPRA